MATTASGCLASEGSQWLIDRMVVAHSNTFRWMNSWDIGLWLLSQKKCNTYWKNEEKKKENKERRLERERTM